MRWATAVRGLVAAGALSALSLGGATTARAEVSFAVDVGVFYNDLAPHGRWIESDGYGWVFVPRTTVASWRPYTRGHWAWTDQYGWLWISDEPYGWATYHYGRWYEDPAY